MIKLLTDIGPVAVYLAVYLRFSDGVTLGETFYSGVVVATAAFLPAVLIALAVSWVRERRVPKLALVTAVFVLVFGGLAVLLNNDTFTKIRPTVVSLFIAGVLGFGLVVQRRSYLQYLMDEMVPLTDRGWWLFTRNFALFFLAQAILNEIIWRGFEERIWVFWDTFGQMGLTLAFMLSQVPLFSKHGRESE